MSPTAEVIAATVATLAFLAPLAAWIRGGAPSSRAHTRAHYQRVTRADHRAYQRGHTARPRSVAPRRTEAGATADTTREAKRGDHQRRR